MGGEALKSSAMGFPYCRVDTHGTNKFPFSALLQFLRLFFFLSNQVNDIAEETPPEINFFEMQMLRAHTNGDVEVITFSTPFWLSP